MYYKVCGKEERKKKKNTGGVGVLEKSINNFLNNNAHICDGISGHSLYA